MPRDAHRTSMAAQAAPAPQTSLCTSLCASLWTVTCRRHSRPGLSLASPAALRFLSLRSRCSLKCDRGQALVEVAITFPVLLLVALGILQLALFAHAQHVVTGAVQDGARVAAAADRTTADGVRHAGSLLGAGLGQAASDVAVTGTEGRDTVTLVAQGRLRTIIPWFGSATLPLGARSSVSKERFHAGMPVSGLDGTVM